jgi:MFS transporter, DHA1 family, inner membrane transport protein
MLTDMNRSESPHEIDPLATPAPPVPEQPITDEHPDHFDRTGVIVVATLAAATFVSGMNVMGLGPFLVDIGADLGRSVPVVGQAVTVTLVTSALAGLVAGPVADHFGHRRLMVAGSLVLAVSAFGTALAPGYALFMAARLVGGLATALLIGLSMAVAGGYFRGDARRRAMSVTLAAMSGTAIIGIPLLAWIGQHFGWRAPFATIGVTALLLLPLLYVYLPRPVPSREPFGLRGVLAAYRPLLGQRAVQALYAGNFVRSIFWLGSLTYFGAFVIERDGLSLQQVGLTYLFGGIGFLIGSLAAGGRLGARNPRNLFAVVTLIGAVFFGSMYLVPLGPVVAVLLLGLGGMFGAVGLVALNTMVVTESQTGAGTSMSLNAAVFNLGSAMGGAVGGVLLAAGGYTMLGLGLPVFALAGSLIVWRSGRLRAVQPRIAPARQSS